MFHFALAKRKVTPALNAAFSPLLSIISSFVPLTPRLFHRKTCGGNLEKSNLISSLSRPSVNFWLSALFLPLGKDVGAASNPLSPPL